MKEEVERIEPFEQASFSYLVDAHEQIRQHAADDAPRVRAHGIDVARVGEHEDEEQRDDRVDHDIGHSVLASTFVDFVVVGKSRIAVWNHVDEEMRDEAKNKSQQGIAGCMSDHRSKRRVRREGHNDGHCTINMLGLVPSVRMREGIPMPERRPLEEKKRERESKVIERNLRFASIAFDLERLLSSETGEFIQGEGFEEVVDVLEMLPESLRARFTDALENYELQIIRSQERLRWLEETTALHERHGMEQKDVMGRISRFMFQQLTGRNPVGATRMELKEGYLLLVMDDPQDYRFAAAGYIWSPDALHVTHSAGLYNHSVSVSIFKETVPVLLVKGDERRVEDVVAHERQHYINWRVFDRFSATEGERDYPDEETAATAMDFRRIKDEILAFMREGRTDFATALREDLYAHLFAGLSHEKKQEALRITDAAASFFQRRLTSALSEGNRAILVYQLAGVPFEKFEHWLKAIEEHLIFDRYRALEEFETEVGMSEYVFESQWYKHVDQQHYPSGYPAADAGYKEETHKRTLALSEVREQAKKQVFNLGFPLPELRRRLSVLLPKYHKARADVWERFMPYMKDGRLAPSSSTPRSYEYGEEDYYARDDDAPELQKAQTALLDFLDQYPQEKIDAVVNALERPAIRVEDEVPTQDASGWRALKKLEAAVKKFIHRQNGSRPCRVELGRDESLPHSIYMRVDFRPAPEKKSSRIKGWVIDVELHGSNLAPPV